MPDDSPNTPLTDVAPLIEPDDDNSEVFRRVPQRPDPDADDSVWWVATIIGAGVTAAGVFVLYETLQIFSVALAAWGQCLQSAGGALIACGDEVTFNRPYRYGVSTLPALAAALFALFVGPIPIIATLNRYQNNVMASILFFVIMIPYGTLAFLVLVISLLITIFYAVQLV